MQQNDNVELFESILKDFDDNGILGDFILIGSWTLRVYSYHFENDPQIPIVATQDLDLLITNPPEVSRKWIFRSCFVNMIWKKNTLSWTDFPSM